MQSRCHQRITPFVDNWLDQRSPFFHLGVILLGPKALRHRVEHSELRPCVGRAVRRDSRSAEFGQRSGLGGIRSCICRALAHSRSGALASLLRTSAQVSTLCRHSPTILHRHALDAHTSISLALDSAGRDCVVSTSCFSQQCSCRSPVRPRCRFGQRPSAWVWRWSGRCCPAGLRCQAGCPDGDNFWRWVVNFVT